MQIWLVTATNVDVGVGSVTAAELYGKVSKEAITEQTEGDESNITAADELLIYDQETDSLLRVSIGEFTVGSGIVTSGGLGEFDNIVVTGLSTISGVEFNSGVITATSGVGVVTFYGDGSNLSELPHHPLYLLQNLLQDLLVMLCKRVICGSSVELETVN